MKQRLVYFLFTGVIAAIAAFVIRAALVQKEATIEALRRGTVPIVVASQALSPGASLDASRIRLAPWPRDQLPPGAITDTQAAVGRIVKTPVVENEPITASQLLDVQQAASVMPILIPPGMRAMSIAVDEVSDMAGFVLPHVRVDVLVTTSTAEGGTSATEQSKIVLQNVEVLAAAQELDASSNQPRAAKIVTLVVTPMEAERLAVASRLGRLYLAMRNYSDARIVETSGVDAAQLLGGPARHEARATVRSQVTHATKPAEKVKTIEVIRNGKQRQLVEFVAGRRYIAEAKNAPVLAVQAPAPPSGSKPVPDSQ